MLSIQKLKQNRGQGTTEYIVILALIVAAILLFWPQIRDAVKEKTKQVSDDIKR